MRSAGISISSFFAKREHEQRDKCAEYSERCHPPDMPDQGKAGDDSKEGGGETLRDFPGTGGRATPLRSAWPLPIRIGARF